jgi:hypothetical protein
VGTGGPLVRVGPLVGAGGAVSGSWWGCCWELVGLLLGAGGAVGGCCARMLYRIKRKVLHVI